MLKVLDAVLVLQGGEGAAELAGIGGGRKEERSRNPCAIEPVNTNEVGRPIKHLLHLNYENLSKFVRTRQLLRS